MQKIICVAILSVIFSQAAWAVNTTPEQRESTMQQRIAAAKAQGLAVAQCRAGRCYDTDDGEYVSIRHSDQDGFYIYDPLSPDMPEERGNSK